MITPINTTPPNTPIEFFENGAVNIRKLAGFSFDSNGDMNGSTLFIEKPTLNDQVLEEIDSYSPNVITDDETVDLLQTIDEQEKVLEKSIDKIDHTLGELKEPLQAIDFTFEEMKEKIQKVMDLSSETLQHTYHHQQPTTSTFPSANNNNSKKRLIDQQQQEQDEYESSSSFHYLDDHELEDSTPLTRDRDRYEERKQQSMNDDPLEDEGYDYVEDVEDKTPSLRRKKKEQEAQGEVPIVFNSKTKLSSRPTTKLVTKEETVPKQYYRVATMATGYLFIINSVLLYFGGEGKLNVNNLYGYGSGSSHLQRTAAVLFLAMGIINLTPNILGGKHGFSLERAAAYFPFVVALLNVIVATHYIFENIRCSETFNWIACGGLILFVILNIKLASLSHPGAIVKVKK